MSWQDFLQDIVKFLSAPLLWQGVAVGVIVAMMIGTWKWWCKLLRKKEKPGKVESYNVTVITTPL